MAKSKVTHMKDPARSADVPGLILTVCGLYLLPGPGLTADPSCQKCLHYLDLRRRRKGRPTRRAG